MNTSIFLSSDGCTQSGLFLALVTSLIQIKTEERLDILRIVKDLRDFRPCLLNDLVKLV